MVDSGGGVLIMQSVVYYDNVGILTSYSFGKYWFLDLSKTISPKAQYFYTSPIDVAISVASKGKQTKGRKGKGTGRGRDDDNKEKRKRSGKRLIPTKSRETLGGDG